MFGLNWRFLLFGAVIVATLSVGAADADACWWWGCYRPWTYSTCYSSCCTVGCDPCYDGGWYLGYRPGPIRRVLFGPYRWYYAGYCGGWDCCYDACYDVCCDTVVARADAGSLPTPAKKPEVPPAPPTEPSEEQPPAPPTEFPGLDTAPPAQPGTLPGLDTAPPADPGALPGLDTGPAAEPGSSASATPANSGLLTVWVPYDAVVTVNGLKTRSTGSRRSYMSTGLRPGFRYKYVVHATVIRDGQPLQDTRTVFLTAGDRTSVAFGFNPRLMEEELASLR